MKKLLFLISSLLLFQSCTPAIMLCLVQTPEYRKQYHFDYSKTRLKSKIVKAYTYDKSLFLKDLGLTLVESKEVNNSYRISKDEWLDKGNWAQFKAQIEQQTGDTLHLILGKHLKRTQIKFVAVLDGNEQQSTLTVQGFTYRRQKICDKDAAYYNKKIGKKIEQKFIKKM